VTTSTSGARCSQKLVRQLQQARPWPLQGMPTVPPPSIALDRSRKTYLVRGAMNRLLPLSVHSSHCWYVCTAFVSAFTATSSESRHFDNERKGSNMNGRLRRLEKTVEALSHGLILALTQLKSESGGRSGDVSRAELHGVGGASPSECDEAGETTPADATDSLSTTLARMGLSENCAEKLYATSSTFRRPTDHGWFQRALKP